MIAREAMPDDAETIRGIWNYHIRETVATFNSLEKSEEDVCLEILNSREAGHAFLVAVDNGTVAGFAKYGQFRPGTGYSGAYEHTVQISRDKTGLGAGRVLMDAIERHARNSGGHTIIACVSGENHEGMGFHRHLGFDNVSILPEVGFKFGRWLDLVLMQKIL